MTKVESAITISWIFLNGLIAGINIGAWLVGPKANWWHLVSAGFSASAGLLAAVSFYRSVKALTPQP